jgi:hypothetical protein
MTTTYTVQELARESGGVLRAGPACKHSRGQRLA